jgi:hypothetical protein
MRGAISVGTVQAMPIAAVVTYLLIKLNGKAVMEANARRNAYFFVGWLLAVVAVNYVVYVHRDQYPALHERFPCSA